MKLKGFTLVELLVVIAIIALLMGILMPALSRVRQLAFRLHCGTNLSGIGKACLVYANDYDDELPKAGSRQNTWVSGIPDWLGLTRQLAFDIGANNTGGKTTITSNFFYLVKYAEVSPKQFICKGESDTHEFSLSEVTGVTVPQNVTLSDVWDFGPEEDEPWKACCYSYHHPFAGYSLTTTSEPTMAVAADRNPWMVPRDAEFAFARFFADEEGFTAGTKETAQIGNSEAHQSEGQNVLFLDSHVQFEKRSYCGTEDDNIYTFMSTTDNTDPEFLRGTPPQRIGTPQKPANRKDSVLVNEGTTTAIGDPGRSGR